MSEQTTITALQDKPSILITRWFDAPRHLVYEACTTPDLVRQWWAPCDFVMTVCEIDLRPGGAWRYVMRTQTGELHGFRGVYREIVPMQRTVQTFIYDLFPDMAALETAELEQHGDRTKLTVTIDHATLEARDGHLQSGMEYGLRQAHEQLDAVLVKLRRAA